MEEKADLNPVERFRALAQRVMRSINRLQELIHEMTTMQDETFSLFRLESVDINQLNQDQQVRVSRLVVRHPLFQFNVRVTYDENPNDPRWRITFPRQMTFPQLAAPHNRFASWKQDFVNVRNIWGGLRVTYIEGKQREVPALAHNGTQAFILPENNGRLYMAENVQREFNDAVLANPNVGPRLEAIADELEQIGLNIQADSAEIQLYNATNQLGEQLLVEGGNAIDHSAQLYTEARNLNLAQRQALEFVRRQQPTALNLNYTKNYRFL